MRTLLRDFHPLLRIFFLSFPVYSWKSDRKTSTSIGVNCVPVLLYDRCIRCLTRSLICQKDIDIILRNKYMTCVQEKRKRMENTQRRHQPKHSRTIQVTIKFLIILWRHRGIYMWRTHLCECAFGVLAGARTCMPRADGAQHKCFPPFIIGERGDRTLAIMNHYEMGNGRKTPAIYTTAERHKIKICFWFFFSCPCCRHLCLWHAAKSITHLDIACKL